MKAFLLLLSGFLFLSCGVTNRFAATDKNPKDTSFVYLLPYPLGVTHLLVQGYNSMFSHKGRLGLDFKMKKGSPISAVRGGVVVRAVESFKKGGLKKKYLRTANQVVIQHPDGTEAAYGHLQHNGILVSVGDTIKAGQVIAKSGSTGYSALPHLHFSLWDRTPKTRRQLPARFYTKKGAKYLKPGRWYKAVLNQNSSNPF